MKKYSLIAAAVTGALLAAGCNQTGTEGQPAQKPQDAAAPVPQATPENAAAIVNGKTISKPSVEMLAAEIGQRRGQNSASEEKIVDELIKRELLRQEAESQQLAKDPKYAPRLENTLRLVLSQIAAEHFMSTAQVSDEELKKEYDQRIGSMKQAEYKARHILVDSEQAAKDVIAKLKKGEKFVDLAKKLSKDPGSKEKGGDLGWFSPQQMVPPFSEAVVALKNGETTQTPVQSQFGWHVILREDAREQQPPPFDTVKDQIRAMLQTQKLQQHIEDLMSKAKIENRLAAAKAMEKPAPADSDSLEAGKPQPPTDAQPVPEDAKPAPPTPQTQPAPEAQPAQPAAPPAQPTPKAPPAQPRKPAEPAQ